MPDPYRPPEPPKEIDILWLTAGLSCDGDTIAITAATQPSIEDLICGAIVQIFHSAALGKLKTFILVVEGSIPDETNKEAGVNEGCRVIERLGCGRAPGTKTSLFH